MSARKGRLSLEYPKSLDWARKRHGKEAQDLLSSMFASAGVSQPLFVSVHGPIHGSAGNASAVRFLLMPEEATTKQVVKLAWQGRMPDSAFEGFVRGDAAERIHAKLLATYPAGRFEERPVPKSERGDDFSDSLQDILLAVCAEAEQYEGRRMSRVMLREAVAGVLPDGHADTVVDWLERKNYLARVDMREGGAQLFEVTPRALDAIGMLDKPAVEPQRPDNAGPGISGFMAELRELTVFVRRQDEIKQAVEALSSRLECTQREARDIRTQMDKLAERLAAAESAAAALEEQIAQAREELDADKQADAVRALREFKQLMAAIPE